MRNVHPFTSCSGKGIAIEPPQVGVAVLVGFSGILLIPLLIAEQIEAFVPGKPGSRWSPSFHKQCRAQ